MAFTIHTEPHKYGAAYSALPLRISSTNAATHMNYKYIINLLYSISYFTADGQTSTLAGEPTTLLTFTLPHQFIIGDTVILKDNSNNYTGIFTVVNIPSTNQIEIDLQLTVPLTGGGMVSKAIRYLMTPDLDGEAKLDLSITLKDFVSQNLEDTPECFAAPDTKHEYMISIGEQSEYVFRFDDNHYGHSPSTGATVGFVNWSMTAADISHIPFQVGDQIQIQQDLYKWDFSDNTFSSGHVGFTSNTNKHDFRVGQQVEITGAIVNSYYNGPTVITNVIDDYTFVTEKPWGSNTLPEAGSAYGIPRPEYNTVATITDIFFESGYGVVIMTDVPWDEGTQAIPGNIIKVGNQLDVLPFSSNVYLSKVIYSARTPRLGWTRTEFDNYVIQTRNTLLNNMSTILEQPNRYRIEPSTKSWLLIHNADTDQATGAMYKFYNAANQLIGYSTVTNQSGNLLDFYVPAGLDQLLANTTRVDSTPLSTIKKNIVRYSVEAVKGQSTIKSKPIQFFINTDCSKYDLYHLMWKDRRGSWISYPFKYINEQSAEYDRRQYYQKEGEFNRLDDSFNYEDFARGEKTYYTRGRDKVKLNTGFIEEFENELIKDLLISSSVYLQTPKGTLLAAQIEDKVYDYKQKQSTPIWNYTIDVRVASNDYRF